MSSAGYNNVPAHVELPALEREVLDSWEANDTFEHTLRDRADAPRWTFYEGPPTANGTPGTHHVEARVFKDVFPRFKTMQGYLVERKAGWDCHGLPVEIAVEKELGFNGKPDIEAFGVDAFNAKCREAVLRNVDLFEEMTERMGYWVDTQHPYRTMDSSYVQSVWWALKQIFDQGLLVEDYRIAPYCPRCGTGLSDHELAQGYETVVDPSVYVRLPLTSGPYAGEAALLVWTTTPWTLPSNALVAARADVTYVTATNGQETLVVGEELLADVLGEDWRAVDTFSGADMVGWTYDRPFDVVPWPGRGHFVVNEDYVTTDDGTGLVHQATVYGADDFESVRRNGIELVNPIDTRGRFEEGLPLIGGMFFKKADAVLVDDLQSRGLLFQHVPYEHSYPHCWRCHTPLMYYGLPSWYVRTTAAKDALLRENERTNWYPDTIKWGRYGDWLNNNIDWGLSRNRYWGTPLPIWRNDADPNDLVCIASLADLSELAGRDLSDLDPHRPYIDDVTFTRDGIEGTYRRVPEVIDAWFDSGSMPFAQWGYPHEPGSAELFERAYPAQYICEAIDQTRGLFYSLMAVGTLVFDRSSYENVVCLGHILAEDGRKMSKHLGNILLPMPLMDEHGADAVRWFMACSGSPWQARRIGHGPLQEIVRKVLLTYWNTVAFHVLYANTAGWTPAADATPLAQRHVLDRWLASKTQTLVRDVTEAMENFETQRAGAALSGFIDDLSNWYVRRSRRRFWDGDDAALRTLHEALRVLTALMAPIVPFVTERVWQDVVRSVDPSAPESVHLASWPTYDPTVVDTDLDDRVELARRVTELGRAARAESKVRTRQPLRRALIGSVAWARLGDELRADVCDELNVGELESLAGAGDLVTYTAKGNFRALGKRFASRTPRVAEAIAEADAAQLATAVKDGGTMQLEVDGETVAVGADDVIVAEHPREGWSVVNDRGETVALDLELTNRLRSAGLAREIVRVLQEGRKNAGLEVSDRITLHWSGGEQVAAAALAHGDEIAKEVLAVEMAQVASVDNGTTDEALDFTFAINRA